jgi:molybdopterin molybdotransferase
MAGIHRVSVHRKPRIAVLVTGDEVARPGTPLPTGQIPDANGPLLLAYLSSWRYTDVQLSYVADRFELVCEALDQALSAHDVVLTTGGVSVGDLDYVPAAAHRQNAHTLFWKVAQKPGMPLLVARRGNSQLFGLPGNPASVLVNLLVYVRPALERLSGMPAAVSTQWQRGRLNAEIRAEREKVFWLRMRKTCDENGQILLEPLGRQASHMLGNLSQAQVLAKIPPASGWPAGTVVEWLPLAVE